MAEKSPKVVLKEAEYRTNLEQFKRGIYRDLFRMVMSQEATSSRFASPMSAAMLTGEALKPKRGRREAQAAPVMAAVSRAAGMGEESGWDKEVRAQLREIAVLLGNSQVQLGAISEASSEIKTVWLPQLGTHLKDVVGLETRIQAMASGDLEVSTEQVEFLRSQVGLLAQNAAVLKEYSQENEAVAENLKAIEGKIGHGFEDFSKLQKTLDKLFLVVSKKDPFKDLKKFWAKTVPAQTKKGMAEMSSNMLMEMVGLGFPMRVLQNMTGLELSEKVVEAGKWASGKLKPKEARTALDASKAKAEGPEPVAWGFEADAEKGFQYPTAGQPPAVKPAAVAQASPGASKPSAASVAPSAALGTALGAAAAAWPSKAVATASGVPQAPTAPVADPDESLAVALAAAKPAKAKRVRKAKPAVQAVATVEVPPAPPVEVATVDQPQA